MGESKHAAFVCRKCRGASAPTDRVGGDRSLCAGCDARQQELCRIATETGERIAADRATAEAEASARWKEAEGKRLRLEQAAPQMLEALREIAGFVTRNSERAFKAHMQALAAQESAAHDPTPGAGVKAATWVTQAQARHHEASRIFHTIEAILGPAIKAATGGET